MKSEKFLLNIQTKCSNITNKTLDTVIEIEQTFKCKWPKVPTSATTLSAEAFPDKI